MTVLTDAEKAFDKILHPFMIKTCNKLRIERNFLNLIKSIYREPTVNIIFFFFWSFFRAALWYMEVLRLEAKSEL